MSMSQTTSKWLQLDSEDGDSGLIQNNSRFGSHLFEFSKSGSRISSSYNIGNSGGKDIDMEFQKSELDSKEKAVKFKTL